MVVLRYLFVPDKPFYGEGNSKFTRDFRTVRVVLHVLAEHNAIPPRRVQHKTIKSIT